MDYWTRRQRELLDQTKDELNKLLESEYERVYKEIYALLVDMYMQIQSEKGPLQSHLYKYNRYYTLSKKIQTILTNLGSKEEKYMGKYLQDLYEKNAKLIGEQFSLSTEIDEERIVELLHTDWVGDGKNFSDRIWDDKNKLANVLRSELVDVVATGKSSAEMAGDISKEFDVEYWKAKRLAVTELNHMQTQSTLDRYKSYGVKKVRVLATMDEKTCEQCRNLNESIVEISEIQFGINIPPFHPNCRCTISAVI